MRKELYIVLIHLFVFGEYKASSSMDYYIPRLQKIGNIVIPVCDDYCDLHCGFQRGNCHCDNRCLLYGDCCIYWEDACLGQATQSNISLLDGVLHERLERLQPGSVGTKCVEIPIENHKTIHIWMETKCPSKLFLPELFRYQDECDHPLTEITSDLTLITPVYVNNLVYKNRYCALCHQHNTRTLDINPMIPNFECFSLYQQALQIFSEKSYEEFLKFAITNCRLFYSLPTEMKLNSHIRCDLKTCDTSLKDTLTNYDQLDIGCRAYQSKITQFLPNNTKVDYKNAHCALCNNVSTDDLLCKFDMPNEGSHQNVTISNPRFPRFSLVLDFETSEKQPSVIVYDKNICAAGRRFDVLQEVCVAEACQQGVFYIDQCIVFDDTSPLIQLSGLLHHYTLLTHWTAYQTGMLSLQTEERISMQVVPIIKELFEKIQNIYNPTSFLSYAIAFGLHIGCDTENITNIDFLLFAENFTTSPIEEYDNVPVCVLMLFHLHLSDSLSIQELIKRKYLLMDTLSEIQEVFELEATLERAMLVDYNAVHTVHKCQDGSILKMREDISLLQDVTDVLNSKGPHFNARVNSTGLSYHSSEVGLGMMVLLKRTTVNSAFVVVCEAPILHCSTVVLCCDSARVINGSLHVQVYGKTTVINPMYFITLNSSEYAVCKDELNYIEMQEPSSEEEGVQGILTLAGHCLSVACLCWTLLTYTLLKPMRTLPGCALMNLALSLALAQIMFQVSPVLLDKPIWCKTAAALTHYLYLVAFAWMNVLAYNTYCVFCGDTIKSNKTAFSFRYLIGYGVYAWGVPLMIVLICVALDLKTDLPVSYRSSGACWIGDTVAMAISFACPILIVLVANLIFFTLTTISLKRTFAIAQQARSTEDVWKNNVVYIKLSSIMGFTWIFGFLSQVPGLQFMVYLFIILSTLQGMFVGVAFTCTPRVLNLWKKLIYGNKNESSASRNQSGLKTIHTDAI